MRASAILLERSRVLLISGTKSGKSFRTRLKKPFVSPSPPRISWTLMIKEASSAKSGINLNIITKIRLADFDGISFLNPSKMSFSSAEYINPNIIKIAVAKCKIDFTEMRIFSTVIFIIPKWNKTVSPGFIGKKKNCISKKKRTQGNNPKKLFSGFLKGIFAKAA